MNVLIVPEALILVILVRCTAQTASMVIQAQVAQQAVMKQIKTSTSINTVKVCHVQHIQNVWVVFLHLSLSLVIGRIEATTSMQDTLISALEIHV
jgi:hypothetical protein